MSVSELISLCFVLPLFFKDSIVGNNMLYRTDKNGPEVEALRNIEKLHRKAAYLFPPQANNNSKTSSENTKHEETNKTKKNNDNIKPETKSDRKKLNEIGEHLLADVFWETWSALSYQLPRDSTMYLSFPIITSDRLNSIDVLL